MNNKSILCVYATRQIDSNLFMSSTIFRGLQEAGYDTYMVFVGYKDVIEDFKTNYAHYFKATHYHEIPKSILYKFCGRNPLSKLAYSFYRHFIADGIFNLPTGNLKEFLNGQKFDCILSFIPPVISGKYAANILNNCLLHDNLGGGL